MVYNETGHDASEEALVELEAVEAAAEKMVSCLEVCHTNVNVKISFYCYHLVVCKCYIYIDSRGALFFHVNFNLSSLSS